MQQVPNQALCKSIESVVPEEDESIEETKR